jgi:hypothetical protein
MRKLSNAFATRSNLSFGLMRLNLASTREPNPYWNIEPQENTRFGEEETWARSPATALYENEA